MDFDVSLGPFSGSFGLSDVVEYLYLFIASLERASSLRDLTTGMNQTLTVQAYSPHQSAKRPIAS